MDLTQYSDEQLIQTAKETWVPTPHPFLPWLTDEELLAAIKREGGLQEIADLYKEREWRITMADEDGDALRYGFELPHWKEADAMLKEKDCLYVSGGKRATKSEWAAKRVVQSALQYPGGVIWCFQDNAPTSIATQQKLIWKYLPKRLRDLNGKLDRRRTWAINYTPKNGFADGVLVLPNKTALHFLAYNKEVTDYQGWEIGAVVKPNARNDEYANIGAWADENMSLLWLETIEMRATSRKSKVIWTFSTTEGITTTIKRVLGNGKVTEWKEAELLPGRINVPGGAEGYMPYKQECQREGWGAIYFFAAWNPFGNNYQGVKDKCKGRSLAYIEENAYGYARDVMNKAFPNFGEWNIIKPESLPLAGTNYMFTDPAGARNWACLWVRAYRGSLYIYRDWPDFNCYGEWAVPAKDSRQPDGDRGPAQRSIGNGTEQYKEMWVGLETVKDPGVERDPYRKKLGKGGREAIFQRYIDPRAGANPVTMEKGGTCLVDEFMNGADPMHFQPAAGYERRVGLTHVNDLLAWDKSNPMDMVTNAPRLFVSEDCQQVIWMMSNYTDEGGEDGGCKDFADLLRYVALADLQHYENEELQSRSPGKGY